MHELAQEITWQHDLHATAGFRIWMQQLEAQGEHTGSSGSPRLCQGRQQEFSVALHRADRTSRLSVQDGCCNHSGENCSAVLLGVSIATGTAQTAKLTTNTAYVWHILKHG